MLHLDICPGALPCVAKAVCSHHILQTTTVDSPSDAKYNFQQNSAVDKRQKGLRLILLMMWWSALGPDIAWSKASLSTSTRWIGANLSMVDRSKMVISIPAKYVEELRAEGRAILEEQSVPGVRLLHFAGRAGWAAGLVPVLGGFVSCLWAAVREVTKEIGARIPASGQVLGGLEADVSVPVSRVRHALEWLITFYSKSGKALVRNVFLDRRRWPARVSATSDASPWGGGAWLAVDGALRVAGSDVDRCRGRRAELRHRRLCKPGRVGGAHLAGGSAGGGSGSRFGKGRSSRSWRVLIRKPP